MELKTKNGTVNIQGLDLFQNINYTLCLLSFIVSYAKWQSILWAILHGFLGIHYLVYYMFYYTNILNQLK